MSEELKPCPFCGDHGDVRSVDVFCVECVRCGTSAWHPGHEQHGQPHWNTRPREEALEELLRESLATDLADVSLDRRMDLWGRIEEVLGE